MSLIAPLNLAGSSGAWPAFLRARAPRRGIAALVVTTLVLSAFWLYQHDGLATRTTEILKLHNPLPTGPDSSGGGGSGPQPPWIDTPPPFDTSWGLVPSSSSAAAALPADDARLKALAPRLREAAARFLARPVLGHEEAAAQNEAACPRRQLDRQVNADQLGAERDKWLAVDEGRIVEMRQAAVGFLAARSREEGADALVGPGYGLDGERVVIGTRGVVIAAGNRRTVERAVACIKELQRLGWEGGVEVWHFEGELEDEMDRDALKALGVGIHMVSTKKAPGQWKNFELKAEAVLRSSFDEVLYLDSDNFPLSDVSDLFTTPLFRNPRSGRAVFWPDLNRDHTDNAIHRVLGIPCHDAWELDSGQMLIAKSGNDGLNLAALYLASYMQTQGDYWFSGGDKDTFRYAHLALGIPYTPAPRWLAVVGNQYKRGARDIFCGSSMLQFGLAPPRPGHADPADPAHPEPLFLHANLVKHQVGVRQGTAFALMRRLSPAQDAVRRDESDDDDDDDDDDFREKRPLDDVVGGGSEVSGRGLCSDIWAFGDAATVETVDAKSAFGGSMGDFEDRYFGSGGRAGAWK